MQPEPAAKISSPRRKFFLLGALFELLLIACNFLPESWLAVEIHNFTLVVHIPLLILLELGLGATVPTAILTLLAGFAVMSCLWGLLFFLVTKEIGSLLIRLSRNQKRFVWFGVGLLGFVCLAWAGISMLPETPRSFESSPEIKSVVDANNVFALDLYQKLKDKPGNLFFSPYSISSALAMTCAGARGQTEMEMTNVLHFNLPSEKLHSAFKTLTARLEGLQRWDRIALKCANSLWCQKDHPFTGDFLKTVRKDYSAEARSVDFKNSPGAAADEINRWIDTKTNHRISAGITPGQITPDLELVLCDTIYFKGKWLNQFKKKDTQPSPFQVTTNESVTVPMMWQSAHFKHAMTEDYSVEMLELPYSGQDLSMVILLSGQYMPDAEHNDVHDLEQKLTPENLRAWLKMLDEKNPHKTSVRLPRFRTASSFNLADELKSLGMASAFSDAADFSGMDGTKNLCLSDVFHQAFVEVNETGTEAAAMTFALAKTKGMDDRFNVDHPFIFLIRDNGSGSFLFLGRIIDPTK
jgi:serine protease inhibitor